MVDDNFYYWLLAASLFFLWLWVRSVRRDVELMRKEVQKVMESILFMRIEKHDETLYAYNALNDEFICQGTSLADLNEKFGQRYPKCKGIIVEPSSKGAQE